MSLMPEQYSTVCRCSSWSGRCSHEKGGMYAPIQSLEPALWHRRDLGSASPATPPPVQPVGPSGGALPTLLHLSWSTPDCTCTMFSPVEGFHSYVSLFAGAKTAHIDQNHSGMFSCSISEISRFLFQVVYCNHILH